MWIKSHCQTYQEVNREEIWKVWKDVDHWGEWHDDLDYCQLEGEFKVGNTFVLKPKGGPKVNIELVEINEGYSFTDCTRFFGARMYDTHAMEEREEGIVVSNRVVVKGPLSWLWVTLVARNVAKSAPQEMDNVVFLARGCDA